MKKRMYRTTAVVLCMALIFTMLGAVPVSVSAAVEAVWTHSSNDAASHGMHGWERSIVTSEPEDFERFTAADATDINTEGNGSANPFVGACLFSDLDNAAAASVSLVGKTDTLYFTAKMRRTGGNGAFAIYLSRTNRSNELSITLTDSVNNPVPDDNAWHDVSVDLSGLDWANYQALREGLCSVVIAPDPEGNGSLFKLDDTFDVKDVNLVYTPTLSNDATLSALTLNGVSVKSFNAATGIYNCNVPYTDGAVMIGAISTQGNSVIEGLGSKVFADGAGTYYVTVTAPDGIAQKIYTISVTCAQNRVKAVWTHSSNDAVSHGMHGWERSIVTSAPEDFERFTAADATDINTEGNGSTNPFVGACLFSDLDNAAAASVSLVGKTDTLYFTAKMRRTGGNGAFVIYLADIYRSNELSITLTDSANNPVPDDGEWHDVYVDLSGLDWANHQALREGLCSVVIAPDPEGNGSLFKLDDTFDVKDANLVYTSPIPVETIWEQTPTDDNGISHGMEGFEKSLETGEADDFERYTVTDAGAASAASNGGLGTPYCGIKLWGDKGVVPLDITKYTNSLKLSVKLRQSGITGQFHVYLNNDFDNARVLNIYGENNPIPGGNEWHEYIIDLSELDWETNIGAAERFGNVVIAPRANWYNPGAIGSQMIDVKDARLIGTSNDATLSDLTVNGVSVKNFDAATTTYSVTVPYVDGTIDIGALPTHEGAVIEGLGIKYFADGTGTYNVAVTAPNEVVTKIYTISVAYAPDRYETVWEHTPTEGIGSTGIYGYTKSVETESDSDFERYTVTNSDNANAYWGWATRNCGIELWGDKGISSVDISSYTDTLKFSVKIRRAGGSGQYYLYFRNDWESDMVEIDLNLNNPIPADGEWHEYTIDISALDWGTENGAAERFGTVFICPYTGGNGNYFVNGDTVDVKDAKLVGQRPLSNDANLTDITLNGVNIKNFDPETLSYDCTVHYTSGIVNIGATVSSIDAFATGLGERTFANSTGSYPIVVHASDGTTKTYTINITGGVSESITFDSSYNVNNNNEITGVVPGTSAIQLIYETEATGNSFITVIQNGNPISGFELLTTGTIVKTMANGMETIYEIVIYMDVNGDGIINGDDIVDTKKHLLGIGDPLDGAYLSAAKCSDTSEALSVTSLVIMKRYIVSIDAQQAFQIEFLDFHPGLPGYDALYTPTAAFSDTPLSDNEYTLVSKTAGVSVGGDKKVLVPVSVWSKGGVVVLEATHIATQISKRIYLKYESLWTLSFEDDFNGNALDSNVWTIEVGDVRQDNEYSICTPDSVIVENGKMVLKAEVLDTPYEGKDYGHAIVNSKDAFSQKYGVFTARVKLPKLGGVYGAFWLLPQGLYGTDNFFVATDTDEVRRCSEIDIMENFGPSKNTGKASSTLHFWDENGVVIEGGAKSGEYEIPDYDEDEFYEYSCIWTETAIYCFVDGKLFFSETNIAPDGSVAGYLMFSLFDAPAKELDSGYNYWYGDMYNDDYPQSMEVDWVKVYK